MNNMKINEIKDEIRNFEFFCKNESVSLYVQGSIMIYEKDDHEFLFGMSYIEHFDLFSLTIDHNNPFSSTWNLFNTVEEMMNRIGRLIGRYEKKELNYQSFRKGMA